MCFILGLRNPVLLNFDMGRGVGGAAAWQPSPWVHPCDCLLLSPCLTCTYSTTNLKQNLLLESTWKNLYCTIKLHVKACNGNYLQLRAMTDICLKKTIKNWSSCSETAKTASWMVSSSSSSVCWLLVLALSYLSYFHAHSGHMHTISLTSRPQW